MYTKYRRIVHCWQKIDYLWGSNLQIGLLKKERKPLKFLFLQHLLIYLLFKIIFNKVQNIKNVDFIKSMAFYT